MALIPENAKPLYVVVTIMGRKPFLPFDDEFWEWIIIAAYTFRKGASIEGTNPEVALIQCFRVIRIPVKVFAVFAVFFHAFFVIFHAIS